MEKQQYLTTIFWKDDYKNKLEDTIMKEEKTTKQKICSLIGSLINIYLIYITKTT